jgi:glycosyltransferase involved in cell wall biosynthesis
VRILHVTRDFPPRSNGGISTAVGGLVAAAERAGVEQAVLSFDAWRPRGKARAKKLPDTGRVVRLTGPDDLPRAAAHARRFAPDLVHVHHAMLWEAARELPTDAPGVFSVHVVQAVQRRLRGLETPTRSEEAQAAAMLEAARVLVPSEATRRDVGALAPGVASTLRVAPFGVGSLPLPAPPPRAGEGERATVLYAGRFADVKGTAELFEAIDRVVTRVPSARFLLAGGLPDNRRAERRWRERFHARTSAAAKDRTDFLGWLDPDALEERYASAALLVAPSWHETFGLAVAEAMARGLAVVASDAGALPELVTHGETGLLVPPRDPEALTDALVELLESPERLARMGAAARATTKHGTWTERIGAFLEAYRLALPPAPDR